MRKLIMLLTIIALISCKSNKVKTVNVKHIIYLYDSVGCHEVYYELIPNIPIDKVDEVIQWQEQRCDAIVNRYKSVNK